MSFSIETLKLEAIKKNKDNKLYLYNLYCDLRHALGSSIHPYVDNVLHDIIDNDDMDYSILIFFIRLWEDMEI